MACLNEAETLAACIEKAQLGIQRSGVCGEVLVADNGSQDASVQIAEELGVRVVHVAEKDTVTRWRAAFTPRPENGLSWATRIRAMISQRQIASSKNSAKALNSSWVAACRAAAGGSCRVQCRFHIAGWETRSSHRWRGVCSLRLSTMFIAACADSHGNCTID